MAFPAEVRDSVQGLVAVKRQLEFVKAVTAEADEFVEVLAPAFQAFDVAKSSANVRDDVAKVEAKEGVRMPMLLFSDHPNCNAFAPFVNSQLSDVVPYNVCGTQSNSR